MVQTVNWKYISGQGEMPDDQWAIYKILEFARRKVTEPEIQNHIIQIRGEYPAEWRTVETLLDHLVSDGVIVREVFKYGAAVKRAYYVLKEYSFGGRP